ncbi:hypothetical protein LCGC14_0752890 [marine sediment metagenome]|uniref:Uncharacterized protein n=1 Tax=marine sediment metagenome TaxID=412755 RepID=A0A0F9Q3F7_9ZZZZ
MFKWIDRLAPFFIALLLVAAICCCSYALIEMVSSLTIIDCNTIK